MNLQVKLIVCRKSKAKHAQFTKIPVLASGQRIVANYYFIKTKSIPDFPLFNTEEKYLDLI